MKKREMCRQSQSTTKSRWKIAPEIPKRPARVVASGTRIVTRWIVANATATGPNICIRGINVIIGIGRIYDNDGGLTCAMTVRDY